MTPMLLTPHIQQVCVYVCVEHTVGVLPTPHPTPTPHPPPHPTPHPTPHPHHITPHHTTPPPHHATTPHHNPHAPHPTPCPTPHTMPHTPHHPPPLATTHPHATPPCCDAWRTGRPARQAWRTMPRGAVPRRGTEGPWSLPKAPCQGPRARLRAILESIGSSLKCAKLGSGKFDWLID